MKCPDYREQKKDQYASHFEKLFHTTLALVLATSNYAKQSSSRCKVQVSKHICKHYISYMKTANTIMFKVQYKLIVIHSCKKLQIAKISNAR